jgi:tetratricopeptide (TPR) repeat protein
VALPSPDGIFTSADTGLRGPLVRHHLAVLAREEGRSDEAEQYWQAALAEAPSYQPVRVGLAELYLHQARWPELETLLAELERQPQAALEAAVLRARAHLARRDFAVARHLLEEAIRQAPQALPPQVVLSHVLLQSGEESAAEPLLRHIVGRDPGQAESWRNLAVLYRRRGRLREAIASAQSGRLHCPHDGELTLLHALLLREGGDWINAETCLLQLLETDSGSDSSARHRRASARHHLAGIYRDLGRVREAMAHWRALLAEMPDFAEARQALAECTAKKTAVAVR